MGVRARGSPVCTVPYVSQGVVFGTTRHVNTSYSRSEAVLTEPIRYVAGKTNYISG